MFTFVVFKLHKSPKRAFLQHFEFNTLSRNCSKIQLNVKFFIHKALFRTLRIMLNSQKCETALYKRYIFVAFLLSAVHMCCGQQAFFADGYHGGIYGHYPMWQTQFMVDKLQEYPDWKINLEIEPESWDVVNDRAPDSLSELRKIYSDNESDKRIEFVNPAYAQPYCYNISGESIIRQFQYGMEKVREHFPDAEFTTYSCEEPCFTSCLPQLLNSLGFKYAVLRNPDTCWGGYTSAFGNDLVRWQSSDGSSILTVPRYACEGLVKGSTWQTESWNNSNSFIQSCFDSDVKYPVGMCFQDAGWKHGPWLENVIRKFYRPSEYVLWTDYINMAASKVTPIDWNFTIEDVKPGLVWGSHILQKLAQEVRFTENRIVMAEKIAAFNNNFFHGEYPDKQLDQAWRTLMLSQHHDCWIVPYNGRPGGNWATNVTEWTRKSNQIADAIIYDSIRGISESDSTDERCITVFNTLGSARNDLAVINLPDGIDAEDISVQDSKGRDVPSQFVTEQDKTKTIIFEASVPAFGYSTYKLKKGANCNEKTSISIISLENDSYRLDTRYYQAVINPSQGGSITSLIAKKMNNIQLVDKGKGLNNLGGYFYDEQKYISTYDNDVRVSIVECGPLLIRLKVEGNLAGNPYIQHITFYDQKPRIDFDLHIDWQNQPGIGAYSQKHNYKAEEWKKAFYNDKYKLQVRFPLKGLGSRVFKNAPFDVCESQLDDTYFDSWDTIKHNVILNWVDVTDNPGKYGMALFSDHTTSYINSPEMPLGLTVQYIGRALWGRNYVTHGPADIKYALLPHYDLWVQAGINAESVSWNEPLLAVISGNRPKNPSKSLLEIDTKGVELTSVTVNNNQYYLRLFNAEADADEIIVNLHYKPEKIQLVELNNKLIKDIVPVKINENLLQLKLNIPRFGVRTIRIY